jgi:hypothetical protein
MSKVFSAHAVSVGGYISGRTPDGDEEFFRELPKHVQLGLLEAVPAPGGTHLRYEVVR